MWNTVNGCTAPKELEIGKTTVYFRKDIVKTKDAENNDIWTYSERQMSLEEYDEYVKLLSSPEMLIILDNMQVQTDLQLKIQEMQSAMDDVLAEILLNQIGA